MKRLFLSLAVALIVLMAAVQAQESKSTTRLQAQHQLDAQWLRQHMKQTEGTLLKALEDSSVNIRKSAVQTLRELEQIFPEYPFKAFLDPLGKKLKDENTDPLERRLVALALEALHSDAGDAIIKATGESTQDKGLQTLCKALLVKGGLYK